MSGWDGMSEAMQAYVVWQLGLFAVTCSSVTLGITGLTGWPAVGLWFGITAGVILVEAFILLLCCCGSDPEPTRRRPSIFNGIGTGRQVGEGLAAEDNVNAEEAGAGYAAV